MTVAAILKQKGGDVAHIPPSATVAEAAHHLHTRRIGALLVQDGNRVVGIISERDIVGCLARHGADTLDMKVDALMTRELKTARQGTTVPEAMAMMTAGRFRHLPVMDGDRLLGVISIGDIVKARISEAEHEVDSLKAYVAGA